MNQIEAYVSKTFQNFIELNIIKIDYSDKIK